MLLRKESTFFLTSTISRLCVGGGGGLHEYVMLWKNSFRFYYFVFAVEELCQDTEDSSSVQKERPKLPERKISFCITT